MFYRFSSLVITLLLLVASGQVMAAGTCTSGGTGGALDSTITNNPWVATTAGTGCSNTAGNIAAPDSTNVLVIRHPIAAPTAASISVSSVTFTSGGSLTLTGKTLNIGSTLNTTNGTVTIGVGGTLDVMGVITNAGTLNANGGTLILNNSLNSASGTLTLITATVKVVGGSATITVPADTAINVLDLSAMDDGTTLIFAGAFNNTVTTLTLPTPNPVGGAAKTVSFKVPDGQTLQIPAGTTGCAAVGTAGVYAISAGLISVTGTQVAGDNVTCTVPPATTNNNTVAVPMFSIEEKAEVFTEEVK